MVGCVYGGGRLAVGGAGYHTENGIMDVPIEWGSCLPGACYGGI